jgi:hypothetical protein
MRESKLKELSGSSRLALGFFNSLIRRIECTKPLAGDGITVEEKDDGFLISVDSFASSLQGNAVTLNVCSNGTPDTIRVLKAT